jgi:hypothetical protein
MAIASWALHYLLHEKLEFDEEIGAVHLAIRAACDHDSAALREIVTQGVRYGAFGTRHWIFF